MVIYIKMGFFDSVGNFIDDTMDLTTNIFSRTIHDTLNIFTPEGHTIKTTKHYDPVYDNNGKYPPRMISPAHDIITEEHDGVWAYLTSKSAELVEHTEDDATQIVSLTENDVTQVLDTGLDLGKETVDNLGQLGDKIIDDTSNILSTPLIIIAGGLAAMLYLSGRQAPQIARAVRYA